MSELGVEDLLHSIIFKEIQLCKGLEMDLEIAKFVEDFTLKASKIVIEAALGKIKTGNIYINLAIQLFPKKKLIEHFSAGIGVKSVRESRLLWQQLTGSAESSAHSCCRTALVYALVADYQKSEQWLLRAEGLVQDLARPNYIRGLIKGSQRNLNMTKNYLEISLEGRAYKTTKDRIRYDLRIVF